MVHSGLYSMVGATILYDLEKCHFDAIEAVLSIE